MHVLKIDQMLKTIGVKSMDELIDQTVPKISVSKNRSILAPGYRNASTTEKFTTWLRTKCSTHTLAWAITTRNYTVILRNVFEIPFGHIVHTISGRNFASADICSITRPWFAILPAWNFANASLLDEATVRCRSNDHDVFVTLKRSKKNGATFF